VFGEIQQKSQSSIQGQLRTKRSRSLSGKNNWKVTESIKRIKKKKDWRRALKKKESPLARWGECVACAKRAGPGVFGMFHAPSTFWQKAKEHRACLEEQQKKKGGSFATVSRRK